MCGEVMRTDIGSQPMISNRTLPQGDIQRLLVLAIKHVPKDHHDYVTALELSYKFDQSQETE